MKNGMTLVSMKQHNGVWVAFIKRESTFQPYIVAWDYTTSGEWEGTWSQGHYFDTFEGAVECYNSYDNEEDDYSDTEY